jgi:hypothetical protein
MANPTTLPQGAETAMDTAFSRDLYLLAPAALPAGMQYAVSGGDGQVLFFVKRSRRGRSLVALGASGVIGFVIFGFVSSVGDSVGGSVLSWGGLAAGMVAGLLVAVGAYRVLLGKRFVSFAPRDRGNVRVLDAHQVDWKHPLEASFSVTGDKGRLLATARRNYLTGLLRTRWVAYGARGEVLVEAIEESWWRALVARLLGRLVPALHTNFTFSAPHAAGTTLAVLNRRQPIQGRHVLDLRLGGADGLDAQVALGLAVLIDVTERG